MNDILAHLVQTNIAVLAQDDENETYMEDNDNKDYITCEEQDKYEMWFQCFMSKYWVHADCSGWDVHQARHRILQCNI